MIIFSGDSAAARAFGHIRLTRSLWILSFLRSALGGFLGLLNDVFCAALGAGQATTSRLGETDLS